MALPDGRPPHPADRRRRRRRADRRLRRLAARRRQRRCAPARGEQVFGHFSGSRTRRAGDGRRAAGRDRAGHLDRRCRRSPPTSLARRGRMSRSSRRRIGPVYANRLMAQRLSGDDADHRRLDLDPRVRAAAARGRGDGAGDAVRGRRRALGRHARPNATPTAASSSMKASGSASAKFAAEAAGLRPPETPAAPAAGRRQAGRQAAAAARPARQERRQLALRRRRAAARNALRSVRLAPPGGRLTGFRRAAAEAAAGADRLVVRDGWIAALGETWWAAEPRARRAPRRASPAPAEADIAARLDAALLDGARRADRACSSAATMTRRPRDRGRWPRPIRSPRRRICRSSRRPRRRASPATGSRSGRRRRRPILRARRGGQGGGHRPTGR